VKMHAYWLLLFQYVKSSTDGIYIWGPSQDLLPDPVSSLSLGSNGELSFIELLYDGKGTLMIHLVKRGTDWPEEESFCSQMLPAVIRDFFTRKSFDIRTQLEEIWAMNFSNPPIAGCRCYTRTMVEFGFDTINDEYTSDALEFCINETGKEIVLRGVPSDKSRVQIGVSTPKQLENLASALFRR
jgi:hypothetical protein